MCNAPGKDFVVDDLRQGSSVGNDVDEIFCLPNPVEVVPREAIGVAKRTVVISQDMVTRCDAVFEPVLEILFFDEAEAVYEDD